MPPFGSTSRTPVPIVTIEAVVRRATIPFPASYCAGFPTMQTPESMFRVPPFPAFPSANRYVNLGSLADALVRVVRSVDAHEGLALVVGPPGTGKSLMCNILVEHYKDTHEVVVLGETPIDSEAALLRRIMHHLGVKLSTIPDNDLQLALIDRVCGEHSAPNGLLILADEAQSMSTQVLEAIRMTTNIMRRGEPRVSAVVCGGPRLDDTLTSPMMEPFTQRIATRCYLHPMNANETREYVREAIRRCGANPNETISDDAISAVHHACSGVPRLINQLMTQAVDCAEAANHTSIGLHDINVAWAYLQQLPSPMLEEPKFAKQSNVEFGQLDETPYVAASVQPKAQTIAQPTADVAESSRPFEDMPFEDEQHAEQVIEFPAADLSDDDLTSADFAGTSASDRDMMAACGSTCGCEPETCVREIEAAKRIDEMSASLEMSDEEAAEGEAFEAAYDESATMESSKQNNATIQWITEPGDAQQSRHEPPLSVRQLASRESLPAALFGDFEQEEQIPVSASLSTSQSQVDSHVSGDLEAMLHEEIVGMSGDMQLYHFPGAESGSISFDSVQGSKASSTSIQNPAPESDMILCGDDSDILIIEDDVNNVSRVEPPRMRREESSVNVDFQAMLARMRGG